MGSSKRKRFDHCQTQQMYIMYFNVAIFFDLIR